MSSQPLATVAMPVKSLLSCPGGPVLAGLAGRGGRVSGSVCGWPAVRLCGRAVGPNFYNKIVSPLRELTRARARARARFVNLIVGVVIQKNDWLKIFKNHWISIPYKYVPRHLGTLGTW